jgi:hypothetical protein
MQFTSEYRVKDTVSVNVGVSNSTLNGALGISRDVERVTTYTHGPYKVPSGRIGQIFVYQRDEMIKFNVLGPRYWPCGTEVVQGSGTAYKYSGITDHFQLKP